MNDFPKAARKAAKVFTMPPAQDDLMIIKSSQLHKIHFKDRCMSTAASVRENLLCSAFAMEPKNIQVRECIEQALLYIKRAEELAGPIDILVKEGK